VRRWWWWRGKITSRQDAGLGGGGGGERRGENVRPRLCAPTPPLFASPYLSTKTPIRALIFVSCVSSGPRLYAVAVNDTPVRFTALPSSKAAPCSDQRRTPPSPQ
jgi:hypothetical protein